MKTYTKSQAKRAIELIGSHGNPDFHYRKENGNMVLGYTPKGLSYTLELTPRGKLLED